MKCQRLVSEGKCQNNCQKEEYSLPLLGSDQARELEGEEWKTLVSHPRLNAGWHLQASVGEQTGWGAALGKSPGVLTPGEGALHPGP